ncbi:DUF6192 family protein [Streptomyces sp. NPDC057740]|uniref:DUF6192 family protein n=1 Tax=Streptomyces sp. NPDC057740 TaxID=3346234 RepID=UPI0036A565F0
MERTPHRQAREDFDRTCPVAPAVRHIERSREFLDLVTAFRSFVAGRWRGHPRRTDRPLFAQAAAHRSRSTAVHRG